jgi:hypothetical protein
MRFRASIAAALTITCSVTLPAQQSPRLDQLLAKMDAYLATYEPRLSELIADETLVQETKLPISYSFMPREAVPAQSPQRRTIKSEVAFIALPENAGWLGFRHVKTVDDRAVENESASLTSALQANRYDAARALLSAGAQFNLGLPRTTNLPNLPLEFLHQRNRKRFLLRNDGRETIGGVNASRIVLLERIVPTMIRNPDTNADMPSVVRAWIGEQTGQLLRAEVRTFISAEAKNADNTIWVEFSNHKELGMLVPIEMRETFPVERPSTGTGKAAYSNFRRFQTSARIVPPGLP